MDVQPSEYELDDAAILPLIRLWGNAAHEVHFICADCDALITIGHVAADHNWHPYVDYLKLGESGEYESEDQETGPALYTSSANSRVEVIGLGASVLTCAACAATGRAISWRVTAADQLRAALTELETPHPITRCTAR